MKVLNLTKLAKLIKLTKFKLAGPLGGASLAEWVESSRPVGPQVLFSGKRGSNPNRFDFRFSSLRALLFKIISSIPL